MNQPTGEQLAATQAMSLLAAEVPLSLLLDLATLNLSGSLDVARTERDDASWVHAAA